LGIEGGIEARVPNSLLLDAAQYERGLLNKDNSSSHDDIFEDVACLAAVVTSALLGMPRNRRRSEPPSGTVRMQPEKYHLVVFSTTSWSHVTGNT
jgi:hypothetical protein